MYVYINEQRISNFWFSRPLRRVTISSSQQWDSASLRSCSVATSTLSSTEIKSVHQTRRDDGYLGNFPWQEIGQ